MQKSLVWGAVFAAIAVVLGAFGAHALKKTLSDSLLLTFETGVKYQMYHAFALLICGVLQLHFSHSWWRYAALFFIIGILLFSGSIYAMVALKASGQVGLGGLGMITPIGGLFFILGWISMLAAALNSKSKLPK